MRAYKHKLLTIILLLITTSFFAANALPDNRLKEWKEPAKKGNQRAQYSLGNAYLRGSEVEVDLKKAIYWFKAAAKKGHAKSEYKLGYLYFYGKGVSRNYKTAATWLKRAADKGYTPAQYLMGKLYADGRGVQINYRTALAWLEKAKSGGYAAAAREISNIKEDIREIEEEAEQQIAGYTSPGPISVPKTKRNPKPKPKKKYKPKPKPKPKPVSKPKPATKPATKPVISNPVTDISAELMRGNWINSEGKPSGHLPSSINKCHTVENGFKCLSDELQYSSPFAEVSYIVESQFNMFKDNGEFTSKNRAKILFVLPMDPDDPSPRAEYPETGWKRAILLHCKFKTTDSISCLNDNFEKEIFTRK